MATTKLTPTIRPMKRADLGQIMALEEAIFPDAWPRQELVHHIAEDNCGALVAVSDSDIIGYACYRVETPQFHLTNLAVAPDWRRKSVANGMLDRILGLAREHQCNLIYLEVRVSNTAALDFYSAAGFMGVDRCRAYYENPDEDALVMLRDIADTGNTGNEG